MRVRPDRDLSSATLSAWEISWTSDALAMRVTSPGPKAGRSASIRRDRSLATGLARP